ITNPLSSEIVLPAGSPLKLPLKGGFVYASPSNRGLWPTDNHNFAPRVGFAYKITDKLVMRGGFGIFYMPAQALITFDSPGQSEGFSSSTSWNATSNGFVPV